MPASAQRSAYSALAYAALGRAGVWVLETPLLAVLLGACASMQIQAAELLNSTVPAVSYHQWVVVGAAFLIPFVLQRTLRGISLISLLAMLVLCTGLAITAASGISDFGLCRPSTRFLELPSPSGFASFFGITAFAFGGTQATILPVQDGMARPRRAAGALATAQLIAGALYVIVGVVLASLYERAEGGVQPLIILNLPRHSEHITPILNWCTALVALLSYPLPLMPVVQLLSPSSSSDAKSHLFLLRESCLRLSLLLLSTLVALCIPNFGRIAGFLGCLNIVSSQLMPPLLHLRLRTLRFPASPRKLILLAVDLTLSLLGLCTLVYFTLLTGRSLASGSV